MSENLMIQSHKGPYHVLFDDALLADLDPLLADMPHFLVDANVARIYASELTSVLSHPNCILIEALEENKSIERTIPIIARLVQNQVRRDHTLVAIGGGVIQDITCFIASILLRGVKWRFVPTTLLSQADSCIGSKSSINLGDTKNILGTFNPPEKILLCTAFLNTLDDKDIRSGIGEILKVHAIAGAKSFDELAQDFDRLSSDRNVLLKYIRSALDIKTRFIEQDEFDQGVRNIFNYGHSFGHAIESATHYAVPHGIAVTIGMDMANFIAVERGLLPAEHHQRMHFILRKNYAQYVQTNLPIDDLLSALMKDKKNTSTMLGLIFPVGPDASIQRVHVLPDSDFRSQCIKFLAEFAG